MPLIFKPNFFLSDYVRNGIISKQKAGNYVQ